MKHVTASEARRNWFSLLDEVAKGQVISIERNGTQVVLRAEKARKATASPKKLISGKDVDNADRWGWEWDDSGKLVAITKT